MGRVCSRCRYPGGQPGERKRSRAWDGELEAYRKAREVDGLSPKTTKLADTQAAYRMADKGVFRQ